MASTGYPLTETESRTNRFRTVTLGHLKNFIGGDYEAQNLSSVLYESRDSSDSAVKLEVWSAPGLSKPTFSEAIHQKYKKISKGFKFGPSWSNHWVKATLNVPKAYHDKERVQFEFDPGCEAMIFTSEGLPLQGITGDSGDLRRIDYIIPSKTYLSPMFGVPDEGKLEVHDDVYFTLGTADIAVPRMDAWHLMWDFQVISDLTKSLPVTSPNCLKAQSVAMEINEQFQNLIICRLSLLVERSLKRSWDLIGPKRKFMIQSPIGTLRKTLKGLQYNSLWPKVFQVEIREKVSFDFVVLEYSTNRLGYGHPICYISYLGPSLTSFHTRPSTGWDDGTQMLVHMTPVDTYNAQANVDDVLKAINNHKDLEWSDKSLLVYGNGDGGGGPLAPMIERLRRIRSAANSSSNSGIPKVTQGPSVSDFYKMLLHKTKNGKELPTWRGEVCDIFCILNTIEERIPRMAQSKKHNRKSEILLREIEYFATLASLSTKDSGYEYPKDELDSLWEIVLLCQFHDVLPGSAIAKVYEDAERLYAEVAQKGGVLLEAARQAALYGSQTVEAASISSNRGGSLIGLNTLSFPRQEIVRIPLGIYDGRSAFSPSNADDDSGFVILATASVVRDANTGEVSYYLANKALSVQISSRGRIVSIVDTELGRELILPGQTSGFVIYQDQPLTYDAWNVDVFHLDTKESIDAVCVKVVEPKGLRASLLIECVYKQSKISATISLDAVPGSYKEDALSLIRFDATIDWHEQHKFLKFEIPLDISSEQATYEIQYDLSEFGYGVALLNDCKYGYACEGSYLRLSLLRGSTSPDPKQDQGMHTMSFGILPHRGHFLESDVPQVAIAFNNPIHLRYAPRHISRLGARNVILDTIKRGEDDNFGFHSRKPIKTVIVRIYEAFGGCANVQLVTLVKAQEVFIVDVLEREIDRVQVHQHYSQQNDKSSKSVRIQDDNDTYKQVVELKLKPFQFMTLKFVLSS
ncbi:hypothetical protein H4Q26_001236 [Puccinia striiformis f. sp. tritici PST-130]|nr:hypothetical protein H4Q26_001236 [Puccinia striiformis f. sp. tritici PST-130]